MARLLALITVLALSLMHGQSQSDFTHVGPWAMSSRCRNPTFGMDGDVNTILSTKKEFQPWVRYNLGTTKVVTAIKFTVRNDKCSPKLCNYIVKIGFVDDPMSKLNVPCLYYPVIDKGESGWVSCYLIPGQYVFVMIPDEMAKLRFAEMFIKTNEDVLNPGGSLSQVVSVVDDLSQIGTGSLSSQLGPDYGPENALTSLENTCAATTNEYRPWYRYRFGARYNIFKIHASLNRQFGKDAIVPSTCGIYVSDIADPRDVTNEAACQPLVIRANLMLASCQGALGRFVDIVCSGTGILAVRNITIQLIPEDMPILSRFNGDLDFYQPYDTYVHGFGTPNSNYFIGLKQLKAVTASRICAMHVLMKDNQNRLRFARYCQFLICANKPSYTLTALNFTGQVPNSLSGFHSNVPFSTFDQDFDLSSTKNCAEESHGGFWYNGKGGTCHETNWMGRYGPSEVPGDNMVWKGFTGPGGYLTFIRAFALCYESKPAQRKQLTTTITNQMIP